MEDPGSVDLSLVPSDALLNELKLRYPSMVFMGTSGAFAGADPNSVRCVHRRTGFLVVQAGMLRLLSLMVSAEMRRDLIGEDP